MRHLVAHALLMRICMFRKAENFSPRCQIFTHRSFSSLPQTLPLRLRASETVHSLLNVFTIVGKLSHRKRSAPNVKRIVGSSPNFRLKFDSKFSFGKHKKLFRESWWDSRHSDWWNLRKSLLDVCWWMYVCDSTAGWQRINLSKIHKLAHSHVKCQEIFIF